MSTARRIVEADRFNREGKFVGWAPMLFLGGDIHHKVLGIVGMGRIGQAVARRGLGFGMKVLYTDAQPVSPELEKELNATFVSQDELLAKSDFVSLHVPLLPETHHLMGAEQFGKMKKTAYLINTSRGPVVDEKALVEALRNNVIAGAGLDVFEDEPILAPGLAELDNAVIVPHIASASIETRTKMATMAAGNIVAYFKGDTPPNMVNPEVFSQK
jgi:glyoxylate reductase